MKYINLSCLLILVCFLFFKIIPIEIDFQRHTELIDMFNELQNNKIHSENLNEILDKYKSSLGESIIEQNRLDEYYLLTIWFTIGSSILMLSNFIYLVLKDKKK